MQDLTKIKLRHSPLTDDIYLIRHGKNENEALDKRVAERDVLQVITEYMMFESPKGSVKKYRFGKQWYELCIKPIRPKERKRK